MVEPAEPETPANPPPPPPPPAQPATVDDLRKKIEAAEHALEQAKADLVRQQDKDRLEQGIEALVAAYRAEYPALKAGDTSARGMLAAETKCLREILSPAVADEVPGIAADVRKIVSDAGDEVAKLTKELADKQAGLAAATVKRDAAATALEALKKPAATVKDRLKAADGFKAELKKAHDVGNYAIAYWLLTDAAKFTGALGDAPITPDDLGAAIRRAWGTLSSEEAKVVSLDAAIKAAITALADAKARLAELSKSVDTHIRERLAALTVPQAEAV